ncbi:MAG: hypothetical protein AAB373_00260 [Patescibacteria group bacterium]
MSMEIFRTKSEGTCDGANGDGQKVKFKIMSHRLGGKDTVSCPYVETNTTYERLSKEQLSRRMKPTSKTESICKNTSDAACNCIKAGSWSLAPQERYR